MLTLTHIQIIAQIAVVAVTFSNLLARPKMIFAWYGRWLDKLETSEKWGWIAYPIGYCEKCTAGQIALWVFVARVVIGWEPNSLALIRGVCFLCGAVLVSEVISNLLGKLSR